MVWHARAQMSARAPPQELFMGCCLCEVCRLTNGTVDAGASWVHPGGVAQDPSPWRLGGGRFLGQKNKRAPPPSLFFFL